jgi:hypothetical protein
MTKFEAHPDEREVRAGPAAPDVGVHLLGPRLVDRIHAVQVGAGAETAASGLDAELVAQRRGDEVGVEQSRPCRMPNDAIASR